MSAFPGSVAVDNRMLRLMQRFADFWWKCKQRVLQLLGFNCLSGDCEVCCPLICDTVVSGGSVPTFRSILLPQSCSWTIGTSARRNIPEDETYIDGCFITLPGWQLSVVHSVRNTGFVQIGTTVMKHVLFFLEVCSIEFRRAVCQYGIFSQYVNLHDSTVNGAEVIVR